MNASKWNWSSMTGRTVMAFALASTLGALVSVPATARDRDERHGEHRRHERERHGYYPRGYVVPAVPLYAPPPVVYGPPPVVYAPPPVVYAPPPPSPGISIVFPIHFR